MTRHFTVSTLVVLACVAAAARPAAAQFGARTHVPTLVQALATPHAVVQGVVLDDRGRPLEGVVISAFGSTSVFAVSDPDGRFFFRNVPYGPYVVRAHLQGYLPPRGRLIQVNSATLTVSGIALTRRGESDGDATVLAAGVGPSDVTAAVPDDDGEGESHDHGEVAWRLRHLKRSVLKETAVGIIDGIDGNDDFLGDSLESLGWAIGKPAKLASMFASVPWNGHIDLLTSTSFDRPQDLLSMQTWLPRGVAFVALDAPTSSGHWTMRGAVNQGQGDVSSWIVAASFQRAPATHQYEAGLSYGTQSFLRPNVIARSQPIDDSRNVGTLYAYDNWTVTPRLAINYGAKYARYDYLRQGALFSPRASVTVTPTGDDTFKVRAAVSHREMAPGAEEFIPPSSGLWLPPERTFSALSSRRGFRAERLDHVEVAAEREWGGQLVTGVRVFGQRVDNQLVTLFGAIPGSPVLGVSHYYVASAGDFGARGWGVSVSRTVANRLRASLDYTQVESTWDGHSSTERALSLLPVVIRRSERERFHDVTTTVDSTLPVTDTHVFVMYKVNSRFDAGRGASPDGGVRFDVQLTQALPFLSFAGADVEMLMAVRSLFREELLDTSVYDEVLAIRPPKRIVGGVTVRF
jgi:Carboxypeptidase regulatory-like domain/TonB dependent receptor-like, beta-barrel